MAAGWHLLVFSSQNDLSEGVSPCIPLWYVIFVKWLYVIYEQPLDGKNASKSWFKLTQNFPTTIDVISTHQIFKINFSLFKGCAKTVGLK